MQNAIEQPEMSAASAAPSTDGLECPACGAVARRTAARFCATCGRELDETLYLPADALRSSYHLQQHRRGEALRERASQTKVQPRPRLLKSYPQPKVKDAEMGRANGASTTALAFVTYALVPYLGILFCPGAILIGGVGLLKSRRSPERGGRRASMASIILGLVILCVQLFLWWILYKVPQWANQL